MQLDPQLNYAIFSAYSIKNNATGFELWPADQLEQSPIKTPSLTELIMSKNYKLTFSR